MRHVRGALYKKKTFYMNFESEKKYFTTKRMMLIMTSHKANDAAVYSM